MSYVPLTPGRLLFLQEEAEYGNLDEKIIPKRQVRILTCLYFVLKRNEEQPSDYLYANIDVIQNLIQIIFEKTYTNDQLVYWIDDLCKRLYVSECYGNTAVSENFFSLTTEGIALFLQLKEASPDLFDSSSYTDLVFIN